MCIIIYEDRQANTLLFRYSVFRALLIPGANVHVTLNHFQQIPSKLPGLFCEATVSISPRNGRPCLHKNVTARTI